MVNKVTFASSPPLGSTLVKTNMCLTLQSVFVHLTAQNLSKGLSVFDFDANFS